ncbi:response regulator [Candidatus Dojkabacteria bacterium]|uniref:Response regulator n=1 Tax=Candidatus Dojkabacteria bacterium TaxID=2099670 RepID=A0A955I1R6_9BACT|nr:response regulator [Candidatus Dojkabacteria bacterium]MCB9791046.1 response regulator [Candidatus Nomurabacteria bacterium]
MDIEKRIVVIEDEPILIKALNIELQSQGFEVLSATDGESGLELVKNSSPSLVLLDILMPKMGGLDVLKAIKVDQNTRDIPVVMFTNLDQEEEKERAMQAGADGYYVKSEVDIGDLGKIIETHINKTGDNDKKVGAFLSQ